MNDLAILWQTADANPGMTYTTDDPGLATNLRQRLYKWRKAHADGAFSDTYISISGSTLIFKKRVLLGEMRDYLGNVIKPVLSAPAVDPLLEQALLLKRKSE